ncbi:immunoglobulin domain-containing protein [Brevifollis gellanilyticus]|uniref:Uncharacterized protein n=1 Tax=Brevifollis gellanilyticus TaxID=748831 RepID=A0A512M6N9_9BACT|nr:immunoglobulin domain-containing protein [Brevifollis gellanilyticus]GEP42011.1 hypothetical protein BGE01nite_13020 [Brevifollis gellanilyticus]
MTPPPSLISVLLKGFLTAGLVLALTGGVQAVAPKAPVITKVDFSFAGFDGNVVKVGNRHSYLVTWTDNSLDEEGFDVQIKAGSDPFFTISRVNANSTQAALIGVPGLDGGTDVLFQIVAWKFNGTRIESTASKTFTYKVPMGTGQAVMTPPENLAVTNVDDSRVKFAWKDNSNSEIFYQIDFKEASATGFQGLTFVNHSGNNFITPLTLTDQTFRLRLVPNTDYNFRVRGTRLQDLAATGTNATQYTNTVTLRTPVLTAPTNLGAETLSERAIRLRWLDNSTNETGYEVQYRAIGDTEFDVLGTLGENVTTVDVPVPQGSSLAWRVVALYTYTPSGATSETTIRSDYSNQLTYSTDFPAPTNLQASMTGRANTVDLTWEDKSGTEYGYNVYTRPQGTPDWFFARATRENMTKVSVSSRTQANDSTGKPVFIPLEAGQVHEFVVRAVSQDETNVSLDSNVASAQARHGFSSRLYHPAQVGAPLTRLVENTSGGYDTVVGYLASTSNAANRSDWNITGLPPGTIFESSTGLLTGTPTQAGIYNCTMTAEFIDSPTVTETLVLRVVPSAVPSAASPYITRAIQPTTIGINTPFRVTLADKFGDPDAETAVALETSLLDQFGKPKVIDIHLFPSLAPRAVANFLSYVNAGDYNSLIFHRLAWNRDSSGTRVSPFVLQAGSLRAVATPRSFASVLSRPAPLNEPGIGNFRGTIAAAKVGARTATATITPAGGSATTVLKDDAFGYVGNPDSGTTDFFVNLGDNTQNLDNQNGGFTVFGRVSGPGMTVVDTITALPEGSYQNNNNTSTYDASLDKRIIVDGSLTAFSGIPMTATPVPTDMDISKTVRIMKASLTPTMRFTVSNPSSTVVNAVVEGNELKLTGLTEGSANVTVIAADLDSNSKSQTFNVIVQKGYRPPVITKHPVSQAVVAGTKVTFSVTATGSNLLYQWRRKIGSGLPANIENANAATYVIPSAQAGDVALYDVVVSNATTILASTPARLDLRTAPAVGVIQQAKIVEVGKPLTLTVTNVVGAPTPTFAWKRGTAAVAGQTTANLNIAAAKLTDGGVYTATASNIVSKATTTPVDVIVVNKAETRLFSTTAKTVSLTAPVTGPNLKYQWRRNTADILANTPRFTGADSAILKITGTMLEDTASYTCVITQEPAGTLGAVETGAIKLFIVQRPSLPNPLSGINAPPTAFIGVDYSWKLPYSPLEALTPSSFTVSGLPPGLKLNAATGVISGRPTAVGIFPIRAIASNIAGASTPVSTGDLRVSPLPFSNIGTFVGTISPNQMVNKNKGGRFELTVQDTAAFSAKLILGTEIIPAAGALGIGSSITGSGAITYQSRIELKRKDKSIVTLLFELDPDLGYITGVVSSGTENAYISGFRQFWDLKWRPCIYGIDPLGLTTTVSYNMSLNLNNDEEDGDVGDQTIPQGSGYLNMIVSPKGTGTISGRLADGTTITSSSMIGPQGEALLFLMLYTNTGSVVGQINLGDDLLGPTSSLRRVDGAVRWIKDVQPATQRNYQAGIPDTTLSILGATYYYKPGSNLIVMGVPSVTSGRNVTLDFSEGGLAGASRNPDRAMRVTTAHTIADPAANDANTTLGIVPATGSVYGSFVLKDDGVTRSVAYQGLVIPPVPYTPAATNSSGVIVANEIAGSGGFATGYFLLPELLPTITKSKIKSGRVVIQGNAITITTQPADATVNPGADVSLTVGIAAGAQGTVTYRWRKDGNSISGATTSNLNLSSITENKQGKYDCVVTNGSYSVTSDFAVVSVNDPVVNPTITRTPSTAKVKSGTKITFSAAVEKGTTPLLYQWKKDGVAIPDATNSTYEITSSTTANTGSYTVTIINIASPSPGVTSATPNVLTVMDAAVITNVSRTPSEEVVPNASQVVFTVTVSGTGPFTYQWKKGNTAITGATSSSYTISSASSTDAASYSVIVKNDVTPDGVASAEVPLAVAAP